MTQRFGILMACALIALATACRRQAQVQRVLPGVSSGTFAELSESTLASMVICHDTLGRPDRPARREVVVTRCTPCVAYGLQASADKAVANARRLWVQRARAPYDTLDIGANCARLSYQYARVLKPTDDSLAVEIALVHLADERDSSRAVALHSIDSLLQQHISDGRHEPAINILSLLGLGIWERAQRQLERPSTIALHRLERRVHRLADSAPPFTQLPPIPRTSSALGASEAEWAARLFDRAARLSTSAPERSRLMRLALAPWVVLENWTALDSAARALLLFAPNDSSLLPARALSAYRSIRRPVFDSPAAMALFDRAVAHVPRADSLRYDSFDGVLSAEDDAWRYGWLPDTRMALDRRGWSVVDPLWSTPVNELRLARRARVAEADYRYADIAGEGVAGSETRPGEMWLRRGPLAARWTVTKEMDNRRVIERSWSGLTAIAELDEANQKWFGSETWRTFYGPFFTPLRASAYEAKSAAGTVANAPSRTEPCIGFDRASPTLYSCAIFQRADWTDVPFFGTTDAIDVTIARFRARADSSDVYIGARIRLRAFKSRNDARADRSDRIGIGAWLTTEDGRPVFHDAVYRELPAANLLAWTQQWTHRTGQLRTMHRVEAMEPTRPSGARGVARFTSDAEVGFPLRGFGMSDVLIAATATPRKGSARRWSDLTVQPNGASVAPGARFAMVWEVYDLTADRNGRVRWRVRIKRERGTMVLHDDMKDVLAGSARAGTRVIADESTAPDVAYVRDAVGGEVVLENIVFGLDDLLSGNHVVHVTIDDLVSGKSVTRGVSVRVLVPKSQERGVQAPRR